ncbi:acid protease [Russula aff. rugulosa BPL654]|nr:acid protease [Russula aff. rugulosa BPL654]
MLLLLARLAPLVVLATGHLTDPSLARASLLKVPISKRIDFNGRSDFTKRDREHLRNLVRRGGHRRRSSTVNKITDIALNNTGGIYVANVSVGDPPANYQLLVDSGSAITWVGANKHYVETKSSVKTKNSVNIAYNIGSFTGLLYNDTVTISENITISQQSIGVASNSSGFNPLDGVLAIGPDDLTLGILNPDNNTIVRTVTDNLFLQGKIQKNMVAVSLEPTTSFPTVNGELTFGGPDPRKYIGDLNYFPLSEAVSANAFWSVDGALRYGNKTIFDRAPGIFDTGSSLLGLATEMYNIYVNATGATLDQTTGLLRINMDQYKKLQSLYFNIEGHTYEFNANAQIWPRALNQLIGGEKDLVYLIVSDLGPETSQETGFIAGMTFLQRFYVVFDSCENRVGLANTQFTDSMNIN